MKYLVLVLLLPTRLLAQVHSPGVPPTVPGRNPPASHDSTTRWLLSLEANQRTFYLSREYGETAFSLAPSLTYSHPSGLYGTLSGYYFNESEPPRYAFTDLEVGYANDLTDRWTYSLSLDRLFFTPPVSSAEKLIENGLEAYTAYDLGPLQAAFDYNLFFGKSSAQTISLALNGNLHKDKWLGFDEVSLRPGAEVFWGSPLALARYGGSYTTTSTALRGRRRNQTTQSVAGQTVYLLGYELALPLEVDRGALAYTLAGHYAIPQRTPNDTAAPLPHGAYLSLQVAFSF